MSNIQIQVYQNAHDNKGSLIDLLEVIEIIAGRRGASANVEQRIIQIRDLVKFFEKSAIALETNEKGNTGFANYVNSFKPQYEELKQGLPAVTWCGTFAPTRAIKNLQQYTSLLVIDIDKLKPDELQQVTDKLNADPHTFVSFTSPSGNGRKALFKVGTADKHKEYFLAIEKYFKETYNITIDTSGKDVSRLCFLSYDESLYHNPDSIAFELPAAIKEISATEQKKLIKISPAEKQTLQTGGQECNDIWESTQQKIQYTEGNRNNFIFKFACNCNRVGISQTECESFATGAAHDLKPDQVKATVNSAYKNNSSEHGTYKKRSKGKAPVGKTNTAGVPANKQNGKQDNNGNGTAKPDYVFWKEIKFEKGKGEEKYWVTTYKLDRVDFCDFLFAKGFHLLQTGDAESYTLVHSGNGIIKPQSPQQVKHYALNWCRQYQLKHIEGLLRDGQTKYFAKNELDSLPYKDVVINRDTEKETFFYFKNGCVVVDDQGNIKERPYSTLDKNIWASSKIDFDFKQTDITLLDANNHLLPYDKINCEFARFIAYASYNPNNEEEKNFSREIITERFLCFCSAIGYLLDGYKHPSNRKGVFAIDHKISERFEAHGRTGKSMIPQACKQLKRVTDISGKTYDPKYQFADEMITVDTQIINYNDMPNKFDVEYIFEKIADPYNVNRRNQGFIHFEYKNSAKVYYNTNFIPKGDGGSYTARMHVIEFSDYFSSSYTPHDEFKHSFFDDGWSADEWLRFYNFMLWCVAYYKMEGVGLKPYPSPNIEARKLVNDVVPEFIDFMEDPNFVTKNTRLKKTEILSSFNEKVYTPLYTKKITPHSFTSWLKKFCTTKGYILNPKQKGGHDKSNSVEYITVADEHWKDEKQSLFEKPTDN